MTEEEKQPGDIWEQPIVFYGLYQFFFFFSASAL